MLDDVTDFVCDLARGTHCVYEAGANRVARHFRELRASFILRESKTAGHLNRTKSSCAVAARAGKKHTNPTAAACFSERFKKLIDGDIELLGAANEYQLVIFRYYTFVRWLHINRVRLRSGCLCDFDYRHGGNSAQETRQVAVMIRIEM